jgi:hypothetical protein
MESLLVFHIGNILVDKNTLCNGYFLNKFFDSIQSLHVIWTVSHFMPCVGHKFLEDVHEDHAISKLEHLVPMQPSGRAFEGVRTPRSV